MEKILNKHALTVCAAISLLFSLFPYVTVAEDSKFNLFSLIGEDAGILPIIALLLPIALIVVNYVLKTDYTKYILIAIPAVAVIVHIIIISAMKSANGVAEAFGVEGAKASVGFVFNILANLAAAGIAVFLMLKGGSEGQPVQFVNSSEKISLNSIKEVGNTIAKKSSETVKNIASSIPAKSDEIKTSENRSSFSTDRDPAISKLKAEIVRIEGQLQPIYTALGKKYAESGSEDFNADEELKAIAEKKQEIANLKNEILEVEKSKMNNKLAEKKKAFEAKINSEKEKLDKALALGVITQEEHDSKVSEQQKKLDNYDEIARIEEQFDLGIISNEEKEQRIKDIIG